ncbi:MAG: hypothetical protein ACOCXJ_00225 [Planctomycetota bacterium]
MGDQQIIRDLAEQVAALAARPEQQRRRDLWRCHHGYQQVGVPLHVSWGMATNEIIVPQLRCEDPFFRRHECTLRGALFHAGIDDDHILEPWLRVRPHFQHRGDGPWGLAPSYGRDAASGGYHIDPPITDLDNQSGLQAPQHVIDERASAEQLNRLQEAVGDHLPVFLDRSPAVQTSLSADLGKLVGIEPILYALYDEPEELHRLMAFLRDGVLAAWDAAQAAGDLRSADGRNQAFCYSPELPDPDPSSPCDMSQLWCFMEAQEFTAIAPAQREEFILAYQKPIMERFGLAAYGCCDDLTPMIPALLEIPNLRRISITPAADIARCAEQIGDQRICSWRPNPSRCACVGFDENGLRRYLRESLAIFRANDCQVDITLKDVATVQHEPERLIRFARIVREICVEGLPA